MSLNHSQQWYNKIVHITIGLLRCYSSSSYHVTPQEDCSYFEFKRTIRTLALRVAGASALPYIEMIKRREQLAFYAQVRRCNLTAL